MVLPRDVNPAPLLDWCIVVVLLGTLSSATGQVFDPSRDCYDYTDVNNVDLVGDRCAEDQHCCGTCFLRYCCTSPNYGMNWQQQCLNNRLAMSYPTKGPYYLQPSVLAGVIAASVVGGIILITGVVIVVMWRNQVACFDRER
ncbi:protein shisa-3 homolog [Lingula anatina]|uniref:Protein shisa-3 homolog n=1 Tax=Lingula anatina TaxID=7574 RepID=A0A1S3HVU8_LINAN|nr:protein shisa-3 homolog [Lingula anatina]|eukprot:XP_013389671.1 protein shisa-3 homolog [Lingula anatina]